MTLEEYDKIGGNRLFLVKNPAFLQNMKPPRSAVGKLPTNNKEPQQRILNIDDQFKMMTDRSDRPVVRVVIDTTSK